MTKAPSLPKFECMSDKRELSGNDEDRQPSKSRKITTRLETIDRTVAPRRVACGGSGSGHLGQAGLRSDIPDDKEKCCSTTLHACLPA